MMTICLNVYSVILSSASLSMIILALLAMLVLNLISLSHSRLPSHYHIPENYTFTAGSCAISKRQTQMTSVTRNTQNIPFTSSSTNHVDLSNKS